MYKIRYNTDNTFVIISPSGNLATKTNGEYFITNDIQLATNSVDYLTKLKNTISIKNEDHILKSIWGII